MIVFLFHQRPHHGRRLLRLLLLPLLMVVWRIDCRPRRLGWVMVCAIAAKEPILMMFWQPHWLFAEEDLRWVEWNKADGECVEETQQKDTACGFAQAHVLKLQDREFATKYPAAAAMIARTMVEIPQPIKA